MFLGKLPHSGSFKDVSDGAADRDQRIIDFCSSHKNVDFFFNGIPFSSETVRSYPAQKTFDLSYFTVFDGFNFEPSQRSKRRNSSKEIKFGLPEIELQSIISSWPDAIDTSKSPSKMVNWYLPRSYHESNICTLSAKPDISSSKVPMIIEVKISLKVSQI